ncbi:hydantoinase/oxoprolinase family protein [Methylobacterium sp. Leaf118]|uniref:hydantoinase/oxoprolinase family protein n=1 Tax=Methylobacterium sp. Leaf118 TaxID=2876562 RepID=UPI001E5157B5|nr:hydantoinase/oxoprolinase family protein [Methylobacterium sp. Leaf118]
MNRKQTRVVGWDLGGVHVKAALIEDGRVVAASQAACALWRGVRALDDTFATLPDWTRGEAVHAVTMTGELTDCFADRADGVDKLSAWAAATLAGPVRIYAGRSGFVAPEAARAHAGDVASANWHATAALVGRHAQAALLVDIGSTTADLIPVVGGHPAARGYSDAERLETGELVYTGVVRTPLLAFATHAPWRGRRTALMAETFATAADIHRLTGDLPEGADQQHSADLKGKSLRETETRLARMVGRDWDEGSPEEWRALAGWFAETQMRPLHDAAAMLLSRPDLPGDAPLVVCGAGRFLAERLAARLGRRSVPLTGLIAEQGAAEGSDWVSTCGPAVAVGLIG